MTKLGSRTTAPTSAKETYQDSFLSSFLQSLGEDTLNAVNPDTTSVTSAGKTVTHVLNTTGNTQKSAFTLTQGLNHVADWPISTDTGSSVHNDTSALLSKLSSNLSSANNSGSARTHTSDTSGTVAPQQLEQHTAGNAMQPLAAAPPSTSFSYPCWGMPVSTSWSVQPSSAPDTSSSVPSSSADVPASWNSMLQTIFCVTSEPLEQVTQPAPATKASKASVAAPSGSYASLRSQTVPSSTSTQPTKWPIDLASLTNFLSTSSTPLQPEHRYLSRFSNQMGDMSLTQRQIASQKQANALRKVLLAAKASAGRGLRRQQPPPREASSDHQWTRFEAMVNHSALQRRAYQIQ